MNEYVEYTMVLLCTVVVDCYTVKFIESINLCARLINTHVTVVPGTGTTYDCTVWMQLYLSLRWGYESVCVARGLLCKNKKDKKGRRERGGRGKK